MEQTSQGNPLNFKMFEHEITEFTASLPFANPSKAAQLLYDKMEQVLAYKATRENKIKLLETLNPAVDKLYTSLKKQLLQVAPLVAIQNKETINWVVQVPMRFATIYASLLGNENILSDTKISDQQAKPYAIFCAIYYILDTLIVCYDLYMVLPKNLWKKLHILYIIAEQFTLLDVTVKHHSNFTSINQLYKTCLLLATASPYQLRRRDIEALYNTIAKWADKVIINKDLTDAIYIVDLSLDAPPVFKILCPQNHNQAYTRGINTHVFIQSIQHIIRQHSDETGIQDTALSKNVFEYIVRSWGGQYQRGSERVKNNGHVEVCIGLTAAHFFISEKKYFNNVKIESDIHLTQQHDKHENSNEKESPFEKKQDQSDPWNMFLGFDTDSNLKQKTQYKRYDFDFVDESADGLCIKTKAKNIPMLQTGEILGIHYPESGYQYQWHIGIVRWFKYQTDETLSVGIQTLAPNALTVAVKVAKKNSAEVYRALLLPELINNQQPSTILLPAGDFNTHVGLKVFYGQNISHIILIDAIHLNSHFYQFTYQTNETATKKPAVEFNKKIKNEQLDNIWDYLLNNKPS